MANTLPENNGIFVRGPDHAQNIFGLNNEFLLKAPKLKFENWVRFNFNMLKSPENDGPGNWVETYLSQAAGDASAVAAMVKTATYPSMDIDTDVLNQYNKKRIVQKKINFDPITIVMHDVADGSSLRFWELYYNYYFRDGKPDKIFKDEKLPVLTDGLPGTEPSDFPSAANGGLVPDTSTHDMFGFKNHKSNNNLIKTIELFYSRGKQYSKVVLINPKISKFQHDTMDYAGVADTMQLTFTIEYENVIYGNNNFELTKGESPANTNDIHTRPSTTMPVRRNGSIPDPNIAKPGAKADLKEDVPITPIGTGGSSIFDAGGLLSGSFDIGDGLLANAAEGLLNNAVTNVQSQLGGIVNNIGNDVANSLVRGIQTGNFSLSPNPIDSAKNVLRNAGSNIVGQATQSARNATGSFIQQQTNAAVGAITSGISNAFSSGANNAQGGSGNGDGQSGGAGDGSPEPD